MEEQCQEHMWISKLWLQMFAENGPQWISHVVTGDKHWISFFTNKDKSSNMAWPTEDDPHTEVLKTGFCRRKRIFTIFINTQGVVAVDILQDKATISAKYYTEVVLKFCRTALSRQELEMARACCCTMTTHLRILQPPLCPSWRILEAHLVIPTRSHHVAFGYFQILFVRLFHKVKRRFLGDRFCSLKTWREQIIQRWKASLQSTLIASIVGRWVGSAAVDRKTIIRKKWVIYCLQNRYLKDWMT